VPGVERVRRRAHPHRAVLALYSRLVRRSALLLALALALYVGLEIASYRSAYPNGVSPLQFQMFEDNPAVRVLSGVPNALDTAGGFAVWDAGWIWELLLAVWAIFITSRFLRGEEDVDRADLVLSNPVRGTRVTVLALAVVVAAGLLVGAVVTATLVGTGNAVRGSVLLGLALAGVCATFASVTAVTSQLVETRRRAAGLAAAVLVVAYVLRMYGSSTDPRAWVRWLTPLGWLDELRPYGAADARALVPFLVVSLSLVAAAVALRARRDVGSALLAPEAARKPHLRLLGSPAAFAWRSNRAVLLGWLLGLGAYAVTMGALVSTMIDWLAKDEGYQRILADLGLDEALTTRGFIGMISLFLGVAVALQVTWRMGAARAEEESGRAEALLARRVTRVRWLAGHSLLMILGGLLLVLVMGSGFWLGTLASGSAGITWSETTRSALNVLPVVVLVGGLAVATFGLAPRLTVPLPATLTVVWFVLSMLGPALSWPTWVLDLSPFTHLALVPAEPWAATAGTVMTGLGLVLAVAGFAGFQRRDVVGR
jgi:ABC-2 type transport system permease protein